ncbi:GNAT family N-acetyltransferase [Zongyangia hominis]|uniref:GNAT family N-acetyltransferase n=1 Tax=Zongyangia hominis TaxID=2763677 RepID=A0A926IAR3_9FIRM|nr:GNAT family N-acetyltransferase [Zongyangia hominis]MBC8569372.1 GNAT family N-acetyltransferase [Zongyangia hominis]
MELCVFAPWMQPAATRFFSICLPASGRTFEPQGRHRALTDLAAHYGDGNCWCLMEGEEIVGTAAVRALGDEVCELKLMYVLPRCQKKGWGALLYAKAEEYARDRGFRKMLLDTLSESRDAIAFYHKRGFVETERYNGNFHADVFMEKIL